MTRSIWTRQFDLDAELYYTKCGVTLFSGEATLDVEYLEDDGAVEYHVTGFRFNEGEKSVTIEENDGPLFNILRDAVKEDWLERKVYEEVDGDRQDQMLDAAERRQEDRRNGY